MLANEETIKAIVEDVKKFVSGIVDTLTSAIDSKLSKTGGEMTGDITRLDESSNSYNLSSDGIEFENGGSSVKSKYHNSGIKYTYHGTDYNLSYPEKSGTLALREDLAKKVNSDIEGMTISWSGQITTADWFLAWDPVDGSGKTIRAISKEELKNVLGLGGLYTAGTNPTCGNGEAITQPGGEAIVSLRTTTGTMKDAGIFYLSQDNAYIANSSDSSYTFGVFDTNLTTNMSNVNDASFVVLSNGGGCKIRGNNVLHTGSWTLVASTTGQNEVNFSTAGYGEFLVKFRVEPNWTLSVLIPKVSMLTTGAYEWWYSGSYKSGDGETTGGTIRSYYNGTAAWFYLDGMFVGGVNKSSECSVYIYAR